MKTGRQSALWLAIVLVLAAALMRWRHEPQLTVCGIKPGMGQQQVEALLGRGWRNSEDTWAYGKCGAVYRGGKHRGKKGPTLSVGEPVRGGLGVRKSRQIHPGGSCGGDRFLSANIGGCL